MPFVDSRPLPAGGAPLDDAWTEFRCDHPREVLALVRSLRDGASPVALSSPTGASLSATLWTVDTEHNRITFDVEAADGQLAGMVEGNEATAVAYLDAIKLQFDLQDLVLVRNPRATALQARLPGRLYRFQRRASYRVDTLPRSAPVAILRHPSLPDMKLQLRVLDLSARGCALLLPDDLPALPLGATLQGAVLALDAQTRLPVTLRLQHASSVQTGEPGLRLGCEFVSLDPANERVLQRHIDRSQLRRRLLSLD